MKDFRFQTSDFRLLGGSSSPLLDVECGGTCFSTSWTRGSASLRPQFLTAHVKQSLGTRRKRVIPRRGEAEGAHKHSRGRENIFSLAQISVRGLSLSSQLGMTEEMNSE
jgi:hypothetical protein